MFENTIENTNTEKTYLPFSDANRMKMPKCDYCNVNMNANCHGHALWCPYNCSNSKPDDMNLDGGIGCLITFVFAYFMYKIISKRVNKL